MNYQMMTIFEMNYQMMNELPDDDNFFKITGFEMNYRVPMI